ncbi:MAG: pyrimidine/purine nucleoside phosphorylase [Desulfuromonadaceae bacterium]
MPARRRRANTAEPNPIPLFKFNTEAPEKMEIIAGSCRVRIAGSGDWIGFPAGTWFEVPGHSFFEIEVADGIAEYVCSFC